MISDGPVWRQPHLLEVELLDARLIRSDCGALDADGILLDRLGGVHRHLVVGLVAVLEAEVVVFQVDVEIGVYEAILYVFPDDASHLISVELDDRILDLDLAFGSHVS